MLADSFPEPSRRMPAAARRWFAGYVEQMITRDVPAVAPAGTRNCCAGTCPSLIMNPAYNRAIADDAMRRFETERDVQPRLRQAGHHACQGSIRRVSAEMPGPECCEHCATLSTSSRIIGSSSSPSAARNRRWRETGDGTPRAAYRHRWAAAARSSQGAVPQEKLPGQHLARGRTRQRLPDLMCDDRGHAVNRAGDKIGNLPLTQDLQLALLYLCLREIIQKSAQEYSYSTHDSPEHRTGSGTGIGAR